jgi:hypothetical protein
MKTYVAHLYGGVNNAYMHDTVVLEAESYEAESYEAAKKKVAIHWGLNPMTDRDTLGRHAGIIESKRI